MMETIKILSVRQPWAWLIVNGLKPVENRSRRSHYRGSLYIHAGKRPADNFEEICNAIEDHYHVTLPDEFDAGGIVGRVNMTGCIHETDNHPMTDHFLFFGPYGYLMDAAVPIEFIPMRGKLGIFTAQLNPAAIKPLPPVTA